MQQFSLYGVPVRAALMGDYKEKFVYDASFGNDCEL